MKQTLCIFNSDKINRNNEIFPASVLESALKQRWSTGMPMHKSHDYHRLIGWTYPFSLLFEPGVTKLVGIAQFPENQDEYQILQERRLQYFTNDKIVECAKYYSEIASRLSDRNLDVNSLFKDSCVAIHEKDVALSTFGLIFNNLDDDGLYPINDLKHLGSGVFDINGLAVFAHPFFRRSFSRINNTNSSLFDYFDEIKSKVRIRIAFDPDLVGLTSTYLRPMELEYWWGPKFDNDLLKIPSGVTKHKANEIDKEFYRISETDFFWYSRKGNRTLEIEEILDKPSFIDQEKYICRYVHSMVDEQSNEIFHLDGAVRIYTEDMMIERIGIDLSKSPKNTEYIKLFRIDNNLNISEWKRLISDYFRDNHMIGEYFGIDDHTSLDEESKAESLSDDTNVKTCYCPRAFKVKEGLMINYSYQPLQKEIDDEVVILSYDFFSSDNSRYNYVEAPIMELIKLIKSEGLKISIPEEYCVIAFEDLYYNFPLFILKDNHIITPFIDSICKLLEFYSLDMTEERQVSFSIEYPIIEKNLRWSFIGSSSALLQIIRDCGYPPNDVEGLSTYIDKLAQYLKQFEEISCFDSFSLMEKTAILHYKRRFLGDEVKYDYVESEGSNYLELSEINDESLFNDLKSGTLKLSKAAIIKKEICNKCGDDYFHCGCSIVNNDTYKIAKDFIPIGLFYTDKKA